MVTKHPIVTRLSEMVIFTQLKQKDGEDPNQLLNKLLDDVTSLLPAIMDLTDQLALHAEPRTVRVDQTVDVVAPGATLIGYQFDLRR